METRTIPRSASCVRDSPPDAAQSHVLHPSSSARAEPDRSRSWVRDSKSESPATTEIDSPLRNSHSLQLLPPSPLPPSSRTSLQRLDPTWLARRCGQHRSPAAFRALGRVAGLQSARSHRWDQSEPPDNRQALRSLPCCLCSPNWPCRQLDRKSVV